MNSKRFLFIIARGDAFGGSSRHVHDMAARLRDDGHVVRVLVGGTPGMEVPRRLAARDVDFTCIPALGRSIHPLKDSIALLSLAKEARRFSPDIISMHASKGGFLGRLACLGMSVPVIYAPHCWSFVDGFPRARLYEILERCMARLTTRIVAVCEQERRFGLSRNVGTAARTVCIHNGLGEASPEPPRRREPRPGDPVRVVMVGRFEEQKDQPLLLRALAGLENLPWRLDLVGEGPRKDACIAFARELGVCDRVEFSGYSSAVDRHLCESDLFVLVSNWEGFPRSILEAMSAGLPVITSDVGGCRESVLDGETGRIVPVGDERKLREALREFLLDVDLRRRLGRRAYEVYRERFTFEHMYRNYLELYGSVVGERLARRPRPGAVLAGRSAVAAQQQHVSSP